MIFSYVYDNEDILLEYRAGSDDEEQRPEHGRQPGRKPTATVSRFLHGPGLDEPLAVERKDTVYYYHADGLGSIVNLTDQRGRVVQSYDYDSFGNQRQHGGRVKQPYTYTGREWDKELGLYYYRARYYDPADGRFISKDPIGFAGGDVNLYRYVQNNPVNFIDPLGLEPWYNDPNHWIAWTFDPANPKPVPSITGPFGPSCGPEGSVLATWIPDIFPESCSEHDDCYGQPGSCQQECDDSFWAGNFAESGPWPNVITPTIYWIGVRLGGESAYNNAQSQGGSQ